MPVSAEAKQLLNNAQFYAQPEEKQITQLSQASPDFNALPYESKQRVLSEAATRIKQKTNIPGTPWYKQPTVPLDKLVTPPSPGQSGPEQVVRGAAQGVAQGVSQFSTPENAGLIGGMTLGGKIPVVGPAIRAGAAAYFTYEQVKSLIESIPELKKAYNEGNLGEIGRVLGNDAVTAIAAGATGKGLVKGVRGRLSRPPANPTVVPPDPYGDMGRSAKEAQASRPTPPAEPEKPWWEAEPEKPWWEGIADKKIEEARHIIGQRGSKKAAGAPSVPPEAPGYVQAWAGGREGLGARTAAPEGYVFPKTLPGKETVASARGGEEAESQPQHGPPEPTPSHKAASKAYGERAKSPEIKDWYGAIGEKVAGKYPTKEAAEAYPDTAAKPPTTGPGKPAKAAEAKGAPKTAKPAPEPSKAKSLAEEDAGNLNKRREEFLKLQKELKGIPDGPQRRDMLGKVSKAIESIDAALKQKKAAPESSRPATTPGGSKGKIAAGQPAPKSAPAGTPRSATPPESSPAQKGAIEPPKATAATEAPAPVREAVKSILEQVQRAKIDRFSIRVKNAEGDEIFSGEYEGDSSPEYVESAFQYLRGAHKIEITPLGPSRGIKAWTKFLAPEPVKAPPG